jgi:hypothetical protein
MLSGAMAGHAWPLAITCTYGSPNISVVFRNTQLGSEALITQAQFDAIAVNDVFMIGHQSVNDRIENNFIDDYFTGINLYGVGVYTRITGNVFARPTTRNNQSTFQQMTAGKAINIMSICGLTANNKTAAQVTAGHACTAPAHTFVSGNSTGPDVGGNTVTEGLWVYGKTFNAFAGQPAFTNDWSWPHTIANNAAGTVRNPGWVNETNTLIEEHAVTAGGSLFSNYDILASGDPQFLGGTNPTTAEGFRPNAGSPLIRAGTPTSAKYDYRGRRFNVPPSIGAYELPAATGFEYSPVNPFQ